jgi:phosphodiesterase/alkaline phosphatase D-like protein
MAIATGAKQGLTRRQLLVRSASTAALAGLGGIAKPYLSRAADRPRITCGLQSGDVSTDSAIVWARADRPARMQVDCSTVESFATIVRSSSIDALPDHDFTAKLLLEGLPPGQEIFYRVRFDDIGEGIAGETQIGHFRTAPLEPRSLSFVWSGDTAGQGWGIDPSRGGMRTYAAMLENRPDFFIHSGDSIYADCPVPYAEDGAAWLVKRARQAFHEFMPIRPIPQQAGRVYRKIAYGPLLDVFLIDMRSYRDSTWNKRDDRSDAFILGSTQLAWLKRELAASDATWKVIAADLSIGLISEDAIALGDGPPERREHEIADLLAFMKRAGVGNTVWLTADMHYTAAHHYDPNRAVFQDFEPFWEFVSGPLHAGTWAPGQLDNTFGPAAMFQKGCNAEQGENLAPCFGLQFFGRVDIDGHSAVMTVTLKDIDNRSLWSVDIAPKPDARPGRILSQHF